MTSIIDDEMIEAAAKALWNEARYGGAMTEPTAERLWVAMPDGDFEGDQEAPNRVHIGKAEYWAEAHAVLKAVAPMIGAKLAKDLDEQGRRHCAIRIRELTGAKP